MVCHKSLNNSRLLVIYNAKMSKCQFAQVKELCTKLTLFRLGGYQIDTCLPFSFICCMIFALNQSNHIGIGLTINPISVL